MVNELLLVVTLILGLQNGRPVESATGFFYTAANHLFLVTNRHVVIDPSGQVRPTVLRLRLHTSAANIQQSADYDVNLYSNGKQLWREHPNFQANHSDIVLIELDKATIQKSFIIKALSAKDFLPQDFVISPGEEVMVIGYPRGISDQLNNLPIVRNASVASMFGVDFQGAPFFLIDSNLHPGTSGSPVMTKPKNTWVNKSGDVNFMTGSPTYFLGIHSATVSTPSAVGSEPLGLASVWYARLIEEIATQ